MGRMKSRVLLAFLPLLVAPGVARSAPKTAAPLPAFQFAEDNLESRWSYRTGLDTSKAGSASWLLGRDASNGVVLQLRPEGTLVRGTLRRVQKGQSAPLATFTLARGQGEFGMVRVGRSLRVTWNGARVAVTETDLGGNAFGTRVGGVWKLADEQMQPTEAVVFRDDFMRATGPDSPEVPDEWKVQGEWKTSGTLGPLADASLSPNPFVFRATGQGAHTARAGKWFWTDYSVGTSIRAVAEESDIEPLVVGVQAFGDKKRGILGTVDFRTGVARLTQNGRVLASSAPFDATIGEWHRMRLETAFGTARLLFDGHEVVRANCDLVEGQASLFAQTGTHNFVDFDDVRIGQVKGGDKIWGEGNLPDRLVKDRLMRNWANAATSWKRDSQGVWWHTGDYWNDARLEVPLPQIAKDGDGFRFYLGATPQSPLKAPLVASIKRTGGQLEVRLNEAKAATFPIKEGKGTMNTLALALRPSAGGRTASLGWNGKALFSVPTSASMGTKIGIQPTHDDAPLPVPPLEKVSLMATTFEREGRSVIGVNITPVSPQIARDLGLPDATGAVIDNVEDDSPAQKAGMKNGDVVRAANGARVLDVDTMRLAVGGVRAPGKVTLEILRTPGDGSGLDWANCVASTSNKLDYAFTSAPVDWKPARGTWEVAERWTCSPQWSFFAGQNDEFPLLWSRFALKGDWTLEAYLATPMDLTRSERSPMDLSISVGDGKNISSGYSFGFAAQNREENIIWRGNQMVVQKDFEMPPGTGETHQDWFYVRLERRQTPQGVRFKWSVNGKPIDTYEDTNPLAGANRLAFWTKNGALSIARVRLWHAGLQPLAPATRPLPVQQVTFPNSIGRFAPRGSGKDASAELTNVTSNGVSALEVRNPRDGGEWTLYVSRQKFNLSQKSGLMSWSYRVTPDVKLNLYALIRDQWREIAWTGGASRPEDNQPTLGQVQGVVSDGRWHTAHFDLKMALQQSGLGGSDIQALAFSTPSRGYLRQGLGGNSAGARYWLRNFKVD